MKPLKMASTTQNLEPLFGVQAPLEPLWGSTPLEPLKPLVCVLEYVACIIQDVVATTRGGATVFKLGGTK